VVSIASAPGRVLKEGSAPLAPALLDGDIGGGDGGEESTRQLLDRQDIGVTGDDELAQLPNLALLELLRPIVERSHLGVIVTRSAHGISCHCIVRTRQLSFTSISLNILKSLETCPSRD
jgi:hypothetical protein